MPVLLFYCVTTILHKLFSLEHSNPFCGHSHDSQRRAEEDGNVISLINSDCSAEPKHVLNLSRPI